MRFDNSFKTATGADTPDFINAEISRAAEANRIKQFEHQQRMNLASDGLTAYDKWTGNNTPITDALRNMKNNVMGAEDMRPTPEGMDVEYNAGEYAADPAITGGTLDDPLSATPDDLFAASAGDMGGDIAAGMGADAAGDMAANAAMDEAMAGVGEAALPAAEAAGDVAGDAAGGIPIVSALRMGDQLAEGDIGGAASTGGKAWMSAAGPYGMAAAAILTALGI